MTLKILLSFENDCLKMDKKYKKVKIVKIKIFLKNGFNNNDYLMQTIILVQFIIVFYSYYKFIFFI
jgi:hypothetical protein